MRCRESNATSGIASAIFSNSTRVGFNGVLPQLAIRIINNNPNMYFTSISLILRIYMYIGIYYHKISS